MVNKKNIVLGMESILKGESEKETAYIEVKNLSKIYKTGEILFCAVDNVNLSIEKGEFVTILGPSGSGKSTLLNIIGGIDNADEGAVFINGTNIVSLSNVKLTEYRRDYIGFVFQFYNLIPNLTVYENIEVVADICKKPLNINELLNNLGIGEQAKKYPIELSGGQQQRVAIARAIVKNPEILLCDEPTGALDFKSSMDILKLLKEINQKYNTTILIVTHNASIANVTHRTIKIRDGKIVFNEKNDTIIPIDNIVW